MELIKSKLVQAGGAVQEIKAIIDLFSRIENGEFSEFITDHSMFEPTEKRLNATLRALCPPEICKELDPGFWDTPDGKTIICVQWWLYGADTITATAAAERIYGKTPTNSGLVGIDRYGKAGVIRRFRRPDSTFIQRRKVTMTNRSSRTWMYYRPDVEKLYQKRLKVKKSKR